MNLTMNLVKGVLSFFVSAVLSSYSISIMICELHNVILIPRVSHAKLLHMLLKKKQWISGSGYSN